MNTNWLVKDPCLNHWFGVRCNVWGQVIGLHFFENKLTGVISTTFGNLKNLRHLSIINGEREFEW